MVRLHSPLRLADLPPVNDPDALISNDLMDGRDAFLMMARDRHYEFSSLRRAKFSSMAMLYELHTQARDSFVYTCNSCHANVDTRYHCSVCDVSTCLCVMYFCWYLFVWAVSNGAVDCWNDLCQPIAPHDLQVLCYTR